MIKTGKRKEWRSTCLRNMMMDYTQCTVLVADDDRDIVRAIATLLEQEGLTVLRAYNGLEALESTFSFRPSGRMPFSSSRSVTIATRV